MPSRENPPRSTASSAASWTGSMPPRPNGRPPPPSSKRLKKRRDCSKGQERIVGAQACCAHGRGRDRPSHETTARQASPRAYECPAESWFDGLLGQLLATSAVTSNCHCDSGGQQSALRDDDLSSEALAKEEAIQPAVAPASFGAAAVARRAEP